MKRALRKRSILKKTFQVGGLTLVSRCLGIVRELLVVRYLGATAISDAFFTAYKIPNSLRKIFAEGALSAAFIPTFVGLVRNKEIDQANRLMLLAFLFFEGIVLLLCGLVMLYPAAILQLIAPGFSTNQIQYAVPFVIILMPFIFFISSSALFAGALQAVHRFFVPAFSPVLLNIVFIASLLVCLTNALPVEWLCVGILCGGLIQFLLHVIAYLRLQFSFAWMNKQTWNHFMHVLIKFGPCLLAMSVMEISLFIDTSFASYLPDGSISLLYYGNRFMGIPLGVFGVAFSTVLLPHFAHVSSYAPKRLHFYLLEVAKFIWWAMVPVALMMAFFAQKVFYTLFLSKKFSLEQVNEAGFILQAFLVGLFFFAFNKIMVNLFYSLHDTLRPMVVSVIATVLNVGFNFVLMHYFAATGLALATTFSGIVQSTLFLYLLYRHHKFTIYAKHFMQFIVKYSLQLLCVLGTLFFVYNTVLYSITHYASQSLVLFATQQVGLWLWVGPLCVSAMGTLYVTRKIFGIKLYFLD